MKLNEQRDTYRDRLAELDILLTQFEAYLHGPKFQGTDPRDGTPNDYINVNEVLRFINQSFRPTLHGERDDVLGPNHDALVVLTLVPERDADEMAAARRRVAID